MLILQTRSVENCKLVVKQLYKRSSSSCVAGCHKSAHGGTSSGIGRSVSDDFNVFILNSRSVVM